MNPLERFVWQPGDVRPVTPEIGSENWERLVAEGKIVPASDAPKDKKQS